MSCCGVICSECEFFPTDCGGCPDIKGKAFWLQFTEEDICGIYDCCIQQKGFKHCGHCSELPCNLFLESKDPTKTKAENEGILAKQIQQLKGM